jgi:hypothetical protein
VVGVEVDFERGKGGEGEEEGEGDRSGHRFLEFEVEGGEGGGVGG